jgi:hypothetical protein
MKNDIIPDIGGASGVQRAAGKTGSGCRITLRMAAKYILKKRLAIET